MSTPLSDRAEVLLRTLVESYIEEGQPQGSRTLARRSGLDLSPATIRSILADLEDLGLVVSPHTSAGRVPTQAGYRMFVDSLVTVLPPGRRAVRAMEDELQERGDPQGIAEKASGLLSQVTSLASVVMLPRTERDTAIQQIEFIRLSSRRVLVILVTDDGQVRNRVIRAERDYSPAELVEAANCFNAYYAGKSLRQVKERLMSEIEQDSQTVQRIMRLATEMTRQVLAEDEDDGDVLVRGESNLLEIPELADLGKLRRLFDAFTTKRDLLHLLDRSLRAGRINIFIGSESGYQALEECSVVTAPYTQGGHVVGTLGVVGPTRMPYHRVIPIVELTARLVSSALAADRD
jgi:heat-inducible transcriptional repressor